MMIAAILALIVSITPILSAVSTGVSIVSNSVTTGEKIAADIEAAKAKHQKPKKKPPVAAPKS